MTRFTLDWSAVTIDGANTVSSSGQTTGFAVATPPSAEEGAWCVATFSGVPGLRANQLQGPVEVTIDFDQPVENLSFAICDVDAKPTGDLSGWHDTVTIMALDAKGNQVPVAFHHSVTGNAIDADGAVGGGGAGAGAPASLGVTIAGQIISLTIICDGGPEHSGAVGISNITFGVVVPDESSANPVTPTNDSDTVPPGKAADDGRDFDILNLIGAKVDFITYDRDDPEAGVVTFENGDTMTFAEIEQVIPCFTPGTLIATPNGEVRVEDLKAGDRILTRDNGIQTISWIGEKRLDHNMLRVSPHLRPILIKAGAMGDGMPERDMLVSPSHRMLIVSHLAELYFGQSEMLVAAQNMLTMEGVKVSDQPYVTYIHFMCDNHEIVLSDGAWSESFQPADFTLKGFDEEQRAELFELFPQLETKEGVAAYRAARRTLKRREAKLLFKG